MLVSLVWRRLEDHDSTAGLGYTVRPWRCSSLELLFSKALGLILRTTKANNINNYTGPCNWIRK